MKKTLTICILMLMSACATNPSVVLESKEPQQKLSFVDISTFDRDLSASLKAPYDAVEVAFYEKVKPNAMPEKLQKWISSVEREGGKVKVEPPPNEPTPRSPLGVFSLLGTLYSSIKNLALFNNDKMFEASKGRDAVIVLERNAGGEVVVSKVQFVKNKI
jgi:hypothetical protein